MMDGCSLAVQQYYQWLNHYIKNQLVSTSWRYLPAPSQYYQLLASSMVSNQQQQLVINNKNRSLFYEQQLISCFLAHKFQSSMNRNLLLAQLTRLESYNWLILLAQENAAQSLYNSSASQLSSQSTTSLATSIAPCICLFLLFTSHYNYIPTVAK